MAKNLEEITPAAVEGGCGARAAAIVAGAALIWRALGAPPLGPVVLGLGGIALIWHGFRPAPAGESPRDTVARVHAKARDAVHRASEDSFPASDPPSWTPTSGPGRRH